MTITPNNVLAPKEIGDLTTYVVDVRGQSADEARAQLKALAVLQTLFPVFRVVVVSSKDIGATARDLCWPVELVPPKCSLLTSVSSGDVKEYLDRRTRLIMATYSNAVLVAPSPRVRELGAAQIIARRESISSANISEYLDLMNRSKPGSQRLEGECDCADLHALIPETAELTRGRVGSEGFLLIEGVEGQFISTEALPTFGLSLKVVEYKAEAERHAIQCLHSKLAADRPRGVAIRVVTAEADSLIEGYGAPFDFQEVLSGDRISRARLAEAVSSASATLAQSLLLAYR